MSRKRRRKNDYPPSETICMHCGENTGMATGKFDTELLMMCDSDDCGKYYYFDIETASPRDCPEVNDLEASQ